jgi:hypothetical protein
MTRYEAWKLQMMIWKAVKKIARVIFIILALLAIIMGVLCILAYADLLIDRAWNMIECVIGIMLGIILVIGGFKNLIDSIK